MIFYNRTNSKTKPYFRYKSYYNREKQINRQCYNNNSIVLIKINSI